MSSAPAGTTEAEDTTREATAERPAGAPSGAVVALEHVTKRYGPPGTPPAVDDLSLTIGAGEICVLVGPSGCGKTTTMKMINRLIEPTSGRITIAGEDVEALPAVELRRRIGYVIQQVGLFPHMTVADNVAVVPRLLRWPDSRIRERVAELLDLVGLDHASYAGRYPAALSGGERQRIGVARALAADPPVMLMDEPFGAVDPIRRERLQNEFLRLQEKVRKTVVFVTHDVDEAIKMADRIAILQRGGVLAQYDTPDTILANPASDFVEHFVGADRGLKRLSLGRVRDLPLAQPVIVRPGDTRADARRRMADDSTGYALLVDGADAPLGWIDERDLTGDGPVDTESARPGAPTVQLETTLRDALSAMLLSSVQLGVVVDERDRAIGVVRVDDISDALRDPGGAAPSGQ
ncbi:MAG TPA: betaine/proline/choline family ABC transporter ATP-binding protein [Candidatus Limnocylindria bacterium]|jgi:osmoprotectant transport system ATP-binding protein|nr:betaine/proline/choline family ABC transporter ATP-binding protein [Candidatus Limnocylindria bacterium]